MGRARTSKLLGRIGALLIVCCCTLTAQGKYGGGSGTPGNPYQIWDANQMQEIGSNPGDWDKHFELMSDIDLGMYRGTEFNIIGLNEIFPFTGTFDGGDFEISNFTYHVERKNYVGLFGYTEGAEIKNVRLVDPNVFVETDPNLDMHERNTFWTGSLVGYLDGTVSSCMVSGGHVIGVNRVGGLVGESDGAISDCSSMAFVSSFGRDSVGGLVGFSRGTISDCNASGTVEGNEAVGGLMGGNLGTVSECCAMGAVNGTKTVGGFIGAFYGSCRDCYSTGPVSGQEGVGGFVGVADSSDLVVMLSNCHSSSSVTGGDYVGGFVGYTFSDVFSECYASGSVAGGENVGGFVGWISNGIVADCYSTASVIGLYNVGGFVGHVWRSGGISTCYSTGAVDANMAVGGLAGMNDNGTIMNSYSHSSVSGISKVGGIVGYTSGVISNCYSTGVVDANGEAGGLIGGNAGAVFDCYWDLEASTKVKSAAGTEMCGSQEAGAMGCDSSYGKSTAEMREKSTYIDWDFDNVWDIVETQTYPYLRAVPPVQDPVCEYALPGDLNDDCTVNFDDFVAMCGSWLVDCNVEPVDPACVPK